MTKYLFSLFITLFALIHAQPLKVGMELDYPPFETISMEGKPSGVSVDIADALGRFLKREIQIINIPFIGLIPSLKSGKIDIILSSMSVTPEREESIAFSDPYLMMGFALLISKKSNLENIQQANESGRKIVVKQATTGEEWADKNLTLAKLIILDKLASCIMEIVQGKADAFIYDQLSVYNAWQAYPVATRANLHAIVEQPWAIGLRKEDVKLKEEINLFLKNFKENGGFTSLADKYMKKEKEAFEKLGVPFPLR